jgi:HTH-type transcriptional regulator / antitoxin HigA
MSKVLKSETDYEIALNRLCDLIQTDVLPDTPESDEMDLLALVIEDFETRHYPILPPNPLDAIRFRLEQLGKDDRELGRILGARSRQSEILNGKRKLNLRMIRALHRELKIPVSSLIADY